jgi:hypothetical protein
MIYYHLGDEIKKYEIDRACGKFERDVKCLGVFFVGKGEREHWEDLGINRIIAVKLILKK